MQYIVQNDFLLNTPIFQNIQEQQNQIGFEQYKKAMDCNLARLRIQFPIIFQAYVQSNQDYLHFDWLFDFVMEQGGMDNERK